MTETASILPTDAKERKRIPLVTGLLDYFPQALIEVARVSLQGNEQHNPGQPLHWDRSKSTDQADCIARHLLQRGGIDTDGMRHSAKLAWRALALLQLELEEYDISQTSCNSLPIGGQHILIGSQAGSGSVTTYTGLGATQPSPSPPIADELVRAGTARALAGERMAFQSGRFNVRVKDTTVGSGAASVFEESVPDATGY